MKERPVNSPESMIAVIRKFGILPLFKSSIPGWSIEDLTAPGCWFDTEGVLGPWDWKIEAVREGDIAYGRFIGGKAAFATMEWYGHLMNWRRSLPRYRMALGEEYKAVTNTEKMEQAYGPAILSAVKAEGEIRAEGLRRICSKKSVYDSVARYLQMGTWLVVGDIQRVYRGPNLTYSGWQRSSLTTPDELFGTVHTEASTPSWARMFEQETGPGALKPDCTPEESREKIIFHILQNEPQAGRETLLKLI